MHRVVRIVLEQGVFVYQQVGVLAIDSYRGAVLEDVLHLVEAGGTFRGAHAVDLGLGIAETGVRLEELVGIVRHAQRDVVLVAPAIEHRAQVLEVAVCEVVFQFFSAAREVDAVVL